MPVELNLSDDEIDSIFSSGEIQGFKDIRMADAINDVFPFPIDGSNAIDDFLRHLDVDPMLSNLNREISSNGTSPPQGYGLDGQSLRLNTPPFSPLAELDGPAFHDLNGSNSLDDMPIIFGNVAVNPSLDFAPPSANADSDISSSSLQEMSIGGGGNEKMINSPSPSYDQDIEVSMDGSDISGQSRARILVPASSGRIMVMVPQAVPKLNPLLQYLKHCGSANSKLMKHQQQKEEDFDSINRVDSSGQAYRWGECMTSAAVRARERRRENKHKLHDMEGTVQKLNTENQQLRLENAQMRREMDSLRNEVASLRSLIPLLEQFQQQGVSKRVQVVVHPVELQQNGAVLKRKQNLESECGHSKKKRRSTRHLPTASYPCNTAQPYEALSDRQLLALELLHRNNVESMPQLVIVKGGMNEVEESKPDLDANRRSQRVVVVRGAARSAAVKQNTAVSGQSLVLVAAERNL